MQNFSLYIDHQSIAPLIRQLQAIVQTASQRPQQPYEKDQIRMTVYQQFIQEIHDLYVQTHPQVKLEDHLIKMEEILQIQAEHKVDRDIQDEGNNRRMTTRGRKTRVQAAKSLQVEVKLVEWLISCDKIMFQKREIDEKYQELLEHSKRSITLNKIQELVVKYNINALIVKTRGGEQHFFGRQTQNTESTIIKKQEQESAYMDRLIQDEQETVNPIFISQKSSELPPNTDTQSLWIIQKRISKDDDQTMLKMMIEQFSHESSSNDEKE